MSEQLILFDDELLQNVIGCDEAGRGPLAGPVSASCVILPKDFPIKILNDSKKLSEKKREQAEITIKEKAIAYSVAWATPAEIDKINILNASMLAMKRAYLMIAEKLLTLDIKPQLLLVDGNKKPDVDIACNAIVKGDALIPEIMAASILAKTARDRFMVCASKRWPIYGFEKHKGYPSKMHAVALLKYGPCPIHRKTFNCPSYQH